MRQRPRLLILAGVLATLLVLTYTNHFHNTFQFDDAHTIGDNAAIRSLSNIPRFFTDPSTFSSLPDHHLYRPMFTTLNTIDYWLAGSELDVFYYHLSIFVSYVILCVLLYLLFLAFLQRIFETRLARYMALLSAAFFSLHTANAETINYISARSDSFSTLMVVAALVSWIYLPAVRRYHLYLVPLVLGFFVKEPALIFVPLLFLYILLFEEEVPLARLLATEHRARLIRALKAVLPATITAAILVILHVQMTPATQVLSQTPRLNYLVTQSFVIAHYLYTFFLPVNLSADTDWYYFTNLLDDRVISGCLVIVALLVAAWRTARRDATRPIAFGILWFFLALAPSSSFVPLAEVLNDHRTFFAYIGLTLALGTVAGLVYRRYEAALAESRAARACGVLLIATVLLGHAFGTRQRNEVWRDGESLWHDVTLKSPNNGRGFLNYGTALMSQGRYEEALGYYKKAERLSPHYSYLHINLGILYGSTEKPEKAREHFQKAIAYASENPSGYFRYGRWLASIGEHEEALANLEEAVRLSPSHAKARELLARVRLQASGDWSPTAEALSTVTRDPTYENYINLSLAHHNAGEYRQTIEACRKALELKPLSDVAYNNICSAYNALEMWDEAVAACEQALAINPGFELARNNLSWARQNLER